MERKNTVLLTVIAVATLLVAVVGATFAYFTATNDTTNNASNITDVTTATVKGVKLDATTALAKKGNLDYPGGVMITGTTVTLSKQDGETDDNDYEATFDLGLKATNKTDQTLKWYLIGAPGTNEISSLTSLKACELQSEKGETNETKYYYNGCSVTEALGKLSDAYLIGFGDINANAENSPLSSKTKEDMDSDANLSGVFANEEQKVLDLKSQKLYTKESQDQKQFTKYTYYLIVEFTDTQIDQNGISDANFGKEISVTFDDISNIISKVVAE